MKRKILLCVLAVIVSAALYLTYSTQIAPTKIALINYQEYMASRIIKSTTNSFIDVDIVKQSDLKDLKKYDFALIFGMGLKLTTEEVNTIKDSEVPTYLWAATNPNLKLTNIEAEILDNISNFLENGGNKNYASLLNYVRKYIDGKSIFVDSISEPIVIGDDVLFRLENDDVFESVSEYEKFAEEKGYLKEGRDKVIMLTSVPGPFNSNSEHIQALIEELESRNYNVYPLASFRKRMELIKEIKPKLIVYMPHGRITMGRTHKALEDLKRINVPILCPLSAFQRFNEWLKDKQGLAGGLLSQSVTMPELDGGIAPFAINALFENENGYLVFKAIPERLKKFGDMVTKYIDLKKKKNQDKKIAIVYFKGPGKNAMVAANMEVLPSLYNTLKRLKHDGYRVTGLPNNFKDFKKIVMTKGPVLGPYAEGAFSEFLKSGYPELIPADLYNKWTNKNIRPEMMEAVNNKYGKAPGNYMSIHKDKQDYLAIARINFGNVVLLPQPMPGVGENTFQLIHGAKTAPPHSYIAPYLWIQEDFKADAIIHFGTHGSLEFTPGKQIALSSYDWTDPLIGTTPHFYIYTISNIGEGMIAKRRSYAVTSTYLTPPFIESKTYNELNKIQKKLRRYISVSKDIQREYSLSIKSDVVKMGLHKDIELDSILDKPYTETEIFKLTNFVEEISNEKISGGLYTLTVPYSKEKINETVTMMSIDPIAYSLVNYDILKGRVKDDIKDNQLLLNKYRTRAKKLIANVLKTKSTTGETFKLIDKDDYERALRWEESKSSMSSNNIMGMMMSMEGDTDEESDLEITQKDKLEVKQLLAKIIPYKNQVDHIKALVSDKKYKSAVSMLNETKLAKVKKISKYVTKMQKTVELASNPNIRALVTIMAKSEGREYVLNFLNDNDIESKLLAEKLLYEKSVVAKLADADIEKSLNQVLANDSFDDFGILRIKKWQKAIKYLIVNKNLILDFDHKADKKTEAIVSKLKLKDTYTKIDDASKMASLKLVELEKYEAEFSETILKIDKTIKSVLSYKENLTVSPENEMLALSNGLGGGYIAPTPGGDPVANPETLPTGRNLYAVNAEATPSKESWQRGKSLANDLLENYKLKHAKYPKKVSFTLWSSSFIETEGSTIAQIFYLLGVKPVWNAFGTVNNLKLIPAAELKRPRIDIVVQTSGQLRDLAASRLFLINKAIEMAANANDSQYNFVHTGILDAEKNLIEKGFSPAEARKLSSARVFGGVNGSYGAAIMGMIESGDKWETEEEIANTYINNMGAAYGTDQEWGNFKKGVFEAALLNTDAVVQPRQSNIWGALSLDHVYEFMGGLNMAVRNVTGKDPESYFNDYRNPNNAKIQGLKEAIWIETRSTLLNPRYIKEHIKGGASSAEGFAETFRNTYGWNVMKPSVIENRLWDDLYNTYIKDELKLGVHKFFKRENPYALQEMSAVMLETVRKGYWKATDEQIKTISKLHAELVKQYEAGCSGFVCDNAKLKDFINKNLSKDLKPDYNKQIDNVRNVNKEKAKDNVVLKKEQKQSPDQHVNTSLDIDYRLLFGFLAAIALIMILIRKRRK